MNPNIGTSEYLQYEIVSRPRDALNSTPATTRSSLTRTKKSNKPAARTVEISYEHLEAAIVNHLYAFGALKRNEEVLWSDIDIALNDKGLVEIEVGVAPAEVQLNLPFTGDPLGR
jgi:hypothetical protein